MDATVLSPGVGQSVVATDSDHRHGYVGHTSCNGAEARLAGDIGSARRDIKDAEAGLARDVGDTRRDVKDSEADIARDIREVDRDIKDSEARLVRDLRDVNRDVKDARWDVTQEVHRAQTAAQLAACHTDEKICDANKDSLLAAKDQLVTSYQIEGRQTVQAEKLAAASVLQAEKLAAAAFLQAEKLAAAAAKQAAECCCELKEKITAESIATRDLINSVEKDRLRDANLALQNQLTAFYTRNVAPPFPPTC